MPCSLVESYRSLWETYSVLVFCERVLVESYEIFNLNYKRAVHLYTDAGVSRLLHRVLGSRDIFQISFLANNLGKTCCILEGFTCASAWHI